MECLKKRVREKNHYRKCNKRKAKENVVGDGEG